MKTTETNSQDVFFLNPNPAGRPRRFPWLAAWLAAALLALLAAGAHAASVAADDASNYSAFGTFTASNLGTGFGAWTITGSDSNGSHEGAYLDTSSKAISLSTKAWGFYGNTTQVVDAQRAFTGTLTNNQVFSVDLQYDGIGTGTGHSTPPGASSAIQAGFELRSGTTARFRFYFVGGQSNCEIDDGTGTAVSIGAGGFPSGGFRVIFKLITVNTYELTVLSPNSGAAVYESGTRTLMGTAGTGIDHVDLYDNDNQAGGGSGNCYFNSLKIGYDAPTISSQPASTTTTCQNTTASFSVTGNSTDGSTVSYAWRKRGNDWGKTWTLSSATANNGFYIGTPANGVNGHVTTTIGSSLWAVWGQTGAAQTAYRPLVSTLANNQSVSISMQHGNIQTATGATATGIPTTASGAGFSLTDGSGNVYFAFQFIGGQTDYTIYDNSSNNHDTGLPFSAGGENITFTLTSSTTYTCQITRVTDGSTTVIAGTLKSGPTGGIQRIYIWNNDTGASDDVFFNNLVSEGADDYGTNYTTSTWITGSDGGQKPLTDGTSGSASGYSGSATSSFTITNAQTSDNGNYDVAVISGQGYTTISSVSALTVHAAPTFTVSQNNLTCNANSSGSITVTAAGGSGSGYQYSDNGGTSFQGGNSFTGLSATTYTVEIEDGNGCFSSNDVVTITQPNAITFSITTNNLTCNGNGSGSIVVSASGGSGTYTYSDNNGASYQGGSTFSGLSASTYQIAVKDSNGCLSPTTPVPLTHHTAVSFTTVSNDNTSCGASGGSITVTPSGGSGTYTYSDNGGSSYQGSSSFTGLASGAYIVVVKDSNGCLSSASSVTIHDPAGPNINLSETDATCTNESNGTVTATFSGTGPFTVSFNSGSFATETSPYTVSNLAAGIYPVVVKDVNGCTSPGSITVSQPTAVTFTNITTNTTCNGGSDGSILITASGGSGSGYQYSDNNGTNFVSTNLFTGLAAGAYSVVVMDSNGCSSATNSVSVGQPAAVTFTVTTNEVSCSGNNNGSITISASGGNGTYNYSDNGGSSYQAGSTFSSLTAGAYSIVVQDTNGCTSSASTITVTQPAAVTFTVTTNEVTCNGGIDGSITISASGGDGSYTYSDNGGTSYQAGNSFTALTAGSYSIVVKDSNGCTSSASTIAVTQPTVLAVTTQPSATTTCNGSSASFSVVAGGANQTYAWRKRGSGWGSGNAWTVTTAANSGTFIGASGKIDSSATTAFGLFANSGASADVYRPFGSLAVGQTIQVDIDNNFINSGGPSTGFGIQNSAGQNLFEFFFAGGNSSYTIHDAGGANASDIPFTQNGIRITFELTSATTYAATFQVLNGGTTTNYSGTLLTPSSGTQVPGQLHFFNFNAGAGSTFDFFFNNLYVGGVPGTTNVALYSDDAANYTALGTGNNFGQGPIANVLPGNTEYSGANTATLTINPATIANGDAANYDVVIYNTCGAVRSSQALLTLNPLPTITLGSSPSLAYSPSASTANLSYSATANGANQYSITFDSTAQTAGFTNVPLTTLMASPIAMTVPAGTAPSTYNGTLTVANSTNGCVSTNYAFTVTVTQASQTITFGALSPITFGAAPFGLTATANSGLTVSFASDNASVATVSGSTVTLVGPGTANIIASQAGNTDYAAATSVTNALTVNTPPVANAVSVTRAKYISVKIPIATLLTNATDYDGVPLTLTAVSASTNGVNVYTNSTFVFYNDTNNVADQFTYTVSDGEGGFATGTVSISIVGGQTGQTNAPVSIGTNGDVTITFAGVQGVTYVAERSTNLTEGEGWVPISTNTAPPDGLFQVIDDFSDLNGGVPVPPSTPPPAAYYQLTAP